MQGTLDIVVVIAVAIILITIPILCIIMSETNENIYMKEHNDIGLVAVTDYEWLNEVPYELLEVYLKPTTFSEEYIEEMRKKYPRWWVK